MSNSNFVCFPCRAAYRRNTFSRGIVPCLSCGKPTLNLGTMIPIPSKKNTKKWKQLQSDVTKYRIESESRIYLSRLKDRHRLEKKISGLLSHKEPYPGIEDDIAYLREKLANI